MATYRCLVVDDESGARQALELALKEEYVLSFAEDGQQALQLLVSHPIDLILLDLRLPDLNGLEVLHRIRRVWPDLAVIVITGYSTHEQAVEAANLGIAGYLIKPWEVDELKCKIRKALGRDGAEGHAEGPVQRAPDRFEAAADYVRDHYAESLNVARVARALGVSAHE